jgi:hypothetical protein
MSDDRRLRLGLAVGLILVVVACSPAPIAPALPASPRPSSAGAAQSGAPATTALGQTGWVAARVEQPVAIEGQPTDAPGFCSPCHPILGTYIQAVVALPAGYLALGFDQPPSHAAAWISTDGATWRRVTTLPAPQASSISAAIGPGAPPAVAGQTGTAGSSPPATSSAAPIVAVGTSAGAAAVWRSSDAAVWSLIPLPPPPAGSTETLSAVAPTATGYVAGGYMQDSTGARTATLWRSADGNTWARVIAPVPAGSSEVTGVVAGPGGTVVAVGISGDERRGTAAAWRSTDGGTSWQAASGPSLAGGRMLAVAAGPAGFVAVGENVDQTGATAWTSPDGTTWTAVGSQPALANDGLQMVMTAVGFDGRGFVADGWKTDAGNGSAVVWRSTDGVSWTRLPQDDTFSGAGMAAILAGPVVLAAGTMGWPDTHAAEVWIAPSN